MHVKITKENIIYLLIILNPFFEIIYSALRRAEIDFPINQFFRLLTLLYFLLLIKKKKTFKTVFTIFCIIYIIWMLQLINGYGEFSFSEVTFLFKIFYTTSLPFIFTDLIRNKTVNKEKLLKITIYSTFIIIISVCLSPFGFGYEAWQNTEYRTGYMGLFSFGNYLTVVLLITLALLIYIKEIRHRIIVICLSLTAIVLLGNKAGLVGICIYSVGAWGFYLYRSKNMRIKLATIIIAMIIIPIAIEYITAFISNQLLLFDGAYNNVTSFLLSNRDLQVQYIKDYIQSNNYNYVEGLVMGYGYSNLSNALDAVSVWRFIEMDLHALRYNLGIIPMLIWISIYFKMAKKSVTNFLKEKDLKNLALALGTGITIVHSIFTGHVVFESLSIIYFSVLYATIITTYEVIDK